MVSSLPQKLFHRLRLTAGAELRKKIWRLLVLRPTGIVPGYIHFRRGGTTKKRYGYQWDDERERGRLYREPRYHDQGEYQIPFGQNMDAWDGYDLEGSIKLASTSKPTARQLEVIESGGEILDTIDKETGYIVEHAVLKREGTPTVILNTQYQVVEKFQSLDIMRVCKAISLEVREVFYGENTFAFDTRARASITGYRHKDLKPSALSWQRSCVPAVPNDNGRPRTDQRLSTTMRNMFDKKRYQPTYTFEDSLMHFFNIIGPINASMVTKVKIEGHYKVTEAAWDGLPTGLSRILPVYSIILKRVCSNLRSLTIHMGTDTRPVYMGPGTVEHGRNDNRDEVKFYVADLEHEEPFDQSTGSQDEKIDAMVKRVVEDLPSLLELKLGDYKSSNMPEKDVKWGKSVQWIDVVDTRARQLYHPARSEAVGGLADTNFDYDNKRGYTGKDCNAKMQASSLHSPRTASHSGGQQHHSRGGRPWQDTGAANWKGKTLGSKLRGSFRSRRPGSGRR